jgi:hypothetical protein
MLIVQLGLCERSRLLSDYRKTIPNAEAKLKECNALLDKIRRNQ